MTPIELAKDIESDFEVWAEEITQEEKPILETAGLEAKLAKEDIEIAHSLETTRASFDALLNSLDREHVYVPEGQELNKAQYILVRDLVKEVYKGASKIIDLTKDHDLSENPSLLDLPESEADKHISLKSLKTKVKAHFILAELYTTLGIKLNPESTSRSAKADYDKVIEEGEKLYSRLSEMENGKLLKLRLAHDIGSAYKRRYDLFFDSDKKIDSDRYGMIETETDPKKESKPILHPEIRKSREWYWKLFDKTQTRKEPFDSTEIFPTEYEFRRYLKDIEKIKEVGCAFQKYILDEFDCSKSHGDCEYKKQDSCLYLRNEPELEDILFRAKCVSGEILIN